MLESAIPEHLQQERTQPARIRPGFEPPYPCYCSRFPESAKELVMAVFGVQYPSKADADADTSSDDATNAGGISKLTSFTGSASSADETLRPAFSELASVTDNRGFHNVAVLAYWRSRAAYEEWAVASGFEAWWAALETDPDPALEQGEVTAGDEEEEEDDNDDDDDDEKAGGKARRRRRRRQRGWFREVFFPSADRLETLFTNPSVPEGAAHLRECVSGPVRDHAYWGGARDRLAAAQTDALAGEPRAETGSGRSAGDDPTPTLARNEDEDEEKKKEEEEEEKNSGAKRCGRVRVPGRRNLVVIRSGQDWRDARPEERRLYLGTMRPTLARGMDFLRDRGGEVGCYSCRFMDVVGGGGGGGAGAEGGTTTDRAFALAYFDDLASLERWSRHHPTHLEIFGGFFRYMRSLDNDITLRLFHEVLVLEPGQQLFEYVGCHDGTGMLASLDGP